MNPQENKSTAIVEYKVWNPSARFNRLQMNTNLNKPPSNWLRVSSRWEQYVRDAAWSRERSDISSIGMAHHSLEKVGEVDVISDSENIKKLLKIPYSKSHVSMMVHRVGKTILLDEFDIHKHLLRQQKDDWKWLRTFYYETVVQSMQGEKCFGRRTKSRDYLQDRNMFSKFLYYSLLSSQAHEGNEEIPLGAESHDEATQPPERSRGERYGSGEFQQNHLWTFEDIRMWIGTDLPIFAGANHPCVSLKLRDAHKPINVLTGLDYWLDNLMCNVPELAMCYHVNGIVQRYEILKTEDIPNLENSQFEAEVIKDIAQNILSFLKANATKEGHTYWLFKGSDQDVVKLYDLTCLCGDSSSSSEYKNPFSVPLGVLLYRVAQNTWHDSGRKKSGLVRTLLKSCLLLLDKALHSQIVTSANYLLADLYIKNDLIDQSLEEQDKEESDVDEEEEMVQRDALHVHTNVDTAEAVKLPEYETTRNKKVKLAATPSETSVNVKALCLSESPTKHILRYDPVTGDVEERSLETLSLVKCALECLDDNSAKEQRESVPRQHNPDEAIPLRYERLNLKPMSAVSLREEYDSFHCDIELPVSSHQSFPVNSWHLSTKLLLLHKLCVVFYWLADCRIKQHKFGAALRFAKNGLHCYSAIRALFPATSEKDAQLLSTLLGQTSDIHVMLVHDKKNASLHMQETVSHDETVNAVMASVEKVLPDSDYSIFVQFTMCAEKNLTISCQGYELALNVIEGSEANLSSHLLKRYGNVCNELGVYHMNKLSSLLNEESADVCFMETIQKLFNKSLNSLKNGIIAFETISDSLNIALLYSNHGRLLRLLGQALRVTANATKRQEFTPQERQNYQKAIDSYQKALYVCNRDGKQDIWYSISWELSSTYFTMATMLQDYAPLSTIAQEEIEKEVTDLMNKALNHCDVGEHSSRLLTCQYRAATIHHRLASLYHNSFRNQVGEQKRKHLRTLAELHYGKASKFFLLVESPCELLRVQLERVALCEYQLSCQTSSNSKLKTLLNGLTYLLDCHPSLVTIELQMADQSEFEAYRVECSKLTKILHSRLQFVTLQMVINQNFIKKSEKSDTLINLYKKMYAVTLKCTYDEEPMAMHSNCVAVMNTIRSLEELYRPVDPGTTVQLL